MTGPDDRELEQYLAGDSPLSRRYREASREAAPPELDEVILAQARAEARRKPDASRFFAPVALAATVVVAVNIGWQVYQAERVPDPAQEASGAVARALSGAPPRKDAPPAAPAPQREQQAAKARSEQMETRERRAAEAAPDAALQSQDAAGAPMPESLKVDRLVGHIAGLRDAVFIRNGKEYGPAEAAKHLQYKREKAGKRIQTADDFIRLCASFSSQSGEAYLIRYPDGRTRTAEDVLREELATMENR